MRNGPTSSTYASQKLVKVYYISTGLFEMAQTWKQSITIKKIHKKITLQHNNQLINYKPYNTHGITINMLACRVFLKTIIISLELPHYTLPDCFEEIYSNVIG